MSIDPKAPDKRAFLSLTAGMLIFPVVDALAKHLGGSLQVPQVLWARYTFQVATLLPLALFLVPWRNWASVDYGRHVPQGLALICTAGLHFAALHYISLAAAAMLLFLSPVYVILLARVVLNERPSIRQWSAVGMGLLGAAFILQPAGANGIEFGSLLAMGAGIANAIYLILVRQSRLTSPPLVTAVATGGIAALVLSLTMPLVWQTPTSMQWPLLVAIGFVGATAQICVIFAYQSGPASILAPLAFLELVSAMAISVAIFGDVPSTAQLIGASIVLLSTGLVVIR